MRRPGPGTYMTVHALIPVMLLAAACEPRVTANAADDHSPPGEDPHASGDDAEQDTGTDTGQHDPSCDDGSCVGSGAYADILPGDAWTGEPSEWTVRHDGLDFAVRSAGAGDTVLVVINGGPGQSHHYCESAEVLATSEVRVVTYDQRGTGDTAHPADGDYSLDAYVSDLEALRQDLGVERVHLLGHSFGGLFAIAYLSAHPERVASVQLYASSPVTYWDSDVTEFEARIAGFESDGTFEEGYNEIENSNDCAPYFQTIWPVYLHDTSFPMTDGLLETTCDLETFFGTSNSNMFGWDYTVETARYEGKVGVFSGESDPFLSETLAIPQHFGAADLQQTVLPECGHYWEECGDRFFLESATFLADAL